MSGAAHYDGLTWDHPRGFEPLDAAARELEAQGAQIRVRWQKQSLEGFESYPIADLARRYDLVVIDHPCLGEVAAQDCFVPVDELFSSEECEVWRRAAVGPSYSSYYYAGKQWALPLDAATQVCVINPEIIGQDSWPETWSDVLDLSGQYPVVLSLAGPHAILSLFSICAQISDQENLIGEEAIFNDETWLQGYELLAAIYQKSAKTHLNCNPIAMLDSMAAGAEIAFCPLIYGYVSYASRSKPSVGKQLVFIDAPRCFNPVRTRSTIGGTGLAVSRKAKVTGPLLDHIRYLMSPNYQVDFAPKHGGQPSSEMAWRNPGVNARANGFYRNTLETICNAWIRPRYNGYVEFQALGSEFLRNALAEGKPPNNVIRKIKAMYNESRISRAGQGES